MSQHNSFLVISLQLPIPKTQLNSVSHIPTGLLPKLNSSFSTTVLYSSKSQTQSHIANDGQSLSRSLRQTHQGLMTRYLLLFDSFGLVFVGRPLWREDGYFFCICCWLLPTQSFSGPSPLGLATVFYCLRFETSLFVASYDSEGHGGGIRPRPHTGDNLLYCRALLITTLHVPRR
jgi:hypothetical protein